VRAARPPPALLAGCPVQRASTAPIAALAS
jgi:hypothetical protein